MKYNEQYIQKIKVTTLLFVHILFVRLVKFPNFDGNLINIIQQCFGILDLLNLHSMVGVGF